MTKIQIVIPFRDRGIDPRRQANLDMVLAWWFAHGMEAVVVDDGLGAQHKSDCAVHNAPALPVGPCDCGAQEPQFNRHRAYNRAIARFPETDVFVFTEADIFVWPSQIVEAVYLAETPGLIVPFTQYRYLSDSTTEIMRSVYEDRGAAMAARLWAKPPTDPESVFGLTPERVMDHGRSIGAVNVVSRETLELTGGFTEATSGNWYDDNIIEEGFTFLAAAATRYVFGPAVHLYHLPGHQGDHLTEADKFATERNKRILMEMREYIKAEDYAMVKRLMSVRVTH